MKRFKQILLFVAIIIILFNVVALFHAYRFTHPVEERIYEYTGYKGLFQKIKITLFGIPPLKIKINQTPDAFNLNYFNISFTTVDNIRLHSWLIPANNSKSVILLVHGRNSNKAALLKYAEFLNKNNYATLLLDLRASGASEGTFTSFGYYEKNDIEAAINFLKNNNFENIGALGFSMGGAALLFYSKENKDKIDAIAIDSVYNNIYDAVARRFKIVYGFPKFPFATALTFYGGILLNFNAFELAPEKFVSEINVPILIINKEENNIVTREDAMRLYDNANLPTEIFIVKNLTQLSDYEEKVLGFFDKYLIEK